jgi:hypothetical protein
MPNICLDTDSKKLQMDLQHLVEACRTGVVSPKDETQKVLNLLVMHAHLTSKELLPEEVNVYMNSLLKWIAETIKSSDQKSIDAICSLWEGETWESIQAKLLTEGSVWHVWWMDGVRKYIAIDRGWLVEE